MKLTDAQRRALMQAIERGGVVLATDRTLRSLVAAGFVAEPRYAYGRRGHSARGTVTDAGRAALQ